MDDNPANPANLPSDPAAQRIVFVAGSGRSGTSLMAGILQQLGYHVPQPEVPADASNPKGFSEPAWVVDFHNRLLRAARVHPSDARPSAWFETGKALNRLHPRTELADWLEKQLAVGQDLVIKDPRLIWFLPMWQQCADSLGARSSVVTMLRHPAEVVASKEKTYGGLLNTTNRTAGWLNLMLYTERSTRDTLRAFVQYADLLEDWTSTVAGLGDALEQPVIQQATAARIRSSTRICDDPCLTGGRSACRTGCSRSPTRRGRLCWRSPSSRSTSPRRAAWTTCGAGTLTCTTRRRRWLSHP